MGATHTLNGSTANIEEEIFNICGKNGADVVIDNTGNPKIIESAYKITSSTGRTVLVGVPPEGRQTKIFTLPLHFEKSITGSHGGESRPSLDIPKYIKLYQAGKLQLDALITDRFGLTDINTAITKMRDGAIAGRCLLKMW